MLFDEVIKIWGTVELIKMWGRVVRVGVLRGYYDGLLVVNLFVLVQHGVGQELCGLHDVGVASNTR